MKIRNGFVSNSSSSSFVVIKNGLSEKQIELIKNHAEEVRKRRFIEKYGYDYNPQDAWDIYETIDTIQLSTIIDNFDMYTYLIGYCDISPLKIIQE